jgi:hypothetical protein
MPHNHTVHLNVRNQPSNGNDGYTNTTASNNAVYSYKYTGGDNGHGNISETIGLGSATIDVDIAGGPNYRISEITFANDTNHQLSWSGGGGSAAVIDANTQVENASYCTAVTDTSANCTFNCDPMISNERNPPKAM